MRPTFGFLPSVGRWIFMFSSLAWEYGSTASHEKKFNKSLVLSENGSFFFVLSFKNLIFGKK